MSTTNLRAEITELASMTQDIERSLRNARDMVAGLLEKTNEIAERASDAEWSLRKAQGWAANLDDQLAD